MKLWRIAAETRKYTATDLSGAGAARSPGRWNDDGEAVVYCAPSIALAVLETAAHVDSGSFPLNRFIVEIDVPDAIWKARLQPKKLPAGWDGIPAGIASVRFGSRWLGLRRTAIACVPSVIVPEESAALINPAHPDAARIRARIIRRFEYDLLFRR